MDVIDKINLYTQKQKDIANELGISKITLNLILKRKQKPGPKLIQKMNEWVDGIG